MRRVAVVTGARSAHGTGLENAEARLLHAVAGRRDELDVRVRVVGRRTALGYSRRLGARWLPTPRLAWRGAELIHLAGLSLPPPRGVPYLATFHDLAALVYPDEGALPPWGEQIARDAVLLTCPSRFTAGELERRLGVDPARIRIVPNGPGQDVSSATPPLSDAERAALRLPARYVLRLGGYTRRKNVGRLLDAWPRVSTDAGLVLAGPPHAARAAALAAAPSIERVHVLDFVPPAVLPRLIRSADAVVTTALYEGFGMTPLEAMAAGVPAVAVRTPAAEETCGDAALLADDDSASVAAALERALDDAQLRARLAQRGLERARQLTWAQSAAALREAYREALARLPGR